MNAEVPVIVITARGDRASRLRSLDAGATDFLQSPVDHAEFITRVRNLLKMSWQHKVIKDRASVLEREVLSMRASVRPRPAGGDRLQQLRGLHRKHTSESLAIGYEPIISLAAGRLAAWQALEIAPFGISNCAAQALGAFTADGSPRMREAFRTAAKWAAVDGKIRLVMSLEGRDVRRPAVADQILGELDAAALAPSSLQLELSSAALSELDHLCVRRLEQLRSCGVRLAVVDLGSLSAAKFASGLFHVLKIDVGSWKASLQARVRDDALRAIRSFAEALGFSLAAAGIHTRDDMTRARGQGCLEAQGRYFSATISASDIPAFAKVWDGSKVAAQIGAEYGHTEGRGS